MEIFNYIIMFIFGTVFGSFYGVVATRLPKNKSIIKPGSYCPKCKHSLKWFDLIPLLSFISTKGRCRYCKKPISIFYPFIETCTAILFCIAYALYGKGGFLNYELLVCLLLFSLNVLIFISDFNYFIILDSPLVISSIIVIIYQIFIFGLKNTLVSILCGLCLFGVMILIKKLGDFLFKRESLGGGDIKLAFFIGLILGVRLGLCALILSTFLALPYSLLKVYLSKEKEVPFGPFIIGACTIVFIFANKFIDLLAYLFNHVS